MNNRYIHILLLLLIGSFSVNGQKIVPSPDDLYADATEFVYSGDYFEALLLFLTLEDRGYNTANINYKIGECYLNIQGQKTRAIPFLKDASAHISDRYSGTTLQEEYAPCKVLLYLGIAYRLNYDFDNAILYFNNYLNALDDPDTENKRLTEYHIERCLNARELIAAPALFTADTLSPVINTTFSNFNPLVTKGEKSLYYMNQLKFYDAVMQSDKNDAGWNDPENLTPEIKSDGDHYITGISADGSVIFLTSYDPYRSGEIYMTSLENDQWSEMKKLNDRINTVFNEAQATLSPNGETLYFTSDRKGGFGGLDIYRAVKNSQGEWDNPENLGPLINSPYNEETPFISEDGKKLFFSSQGHYNMGGYDIFVSTRGNDGNWLPPLNIGYPLNTTDDDLFFFPLDSGNIAYQSRFRLSSGQMDILRFSVKAYGKPARFTVIGKMNISADPGFNPSQIEVSFLNKKLLDTLSVKSLNDDGSFNQKLSAGSYRINFSEGAQVLLTKDLMIPDYLPTNNLVLQDNLTVPSKVTVVTDTVYVSNILFDFNNTNPEKSCLATLDKLVDIMNKYPQSTVEVNGYTDALGKESYNMKLSLKRANSVRDYLSAVIAPQRINVSGYGEQNPVAHNIHPDGSDNPEGRRYNRRAELVIIQLPDSVKVIKVVGIPEELLLK